MKDSFNPTHPRLFFGAHVEAPWPKNYPAARMIPEETRHITLTFLGETPMPPLESIPIPEFNIGPVGIGKSLLFLPQEKSRVASLSVRWLKSSLELEGYQKTLTNWLKQAGYRLDERPFFPHISMARAPFNLEAWSEHFTPLPFFVSGIHLYQSLGGLQYQSLWQCPLLAPFEEFEHTADIAYLIRGNTVQELHLHAQMALSFKFPQLINFFSDTLQNSLEEIIIALNQMVAKADTESGCPFKAISFHGEIKETQNRLDWEMIVDV